MKVYWGRNWRGIWKASTDRDKVKNLGCLFESDIPCIHNDKVYIIKVYYGFDYGKYQMYDVDDYEEQVYHSIASAKKNSEIWKKKEALVKENPSKYHVTHYSIASDAFGEPFLYGDVMEGNFHMKIIGVKVI